MAALEGPEGDDRAGTRQIAFTIAVIALGAKMAKVDGQVDRSEIAAFKEVFQVPQSEDPPMSPGSSTWPSGTRGASSPYAQQIAKMFPTGSSGAGGVARRPLPHRAGGRRRSMTRKSPIWPRVARLFGFSEADFARIREANVGARHG